jgi:hypothetical protein
MPWNYGQPVERNRGDPSWRELPAQRHAPRSAGVERLVLLVAA